MTDGEALRGRMGEIVAIAREGTGVRGERLLVAALVASPFAGGLGIWLAWLTWWPNPVIWVFVALAEVAGAAYSAGSMARTVE
ncbi:hypothetical protein [Amaricoccus sp.]|uniref:hypothetical protein n=1 Tax=Amaricoccus sp. TaxID=1872485 RepID=UPI001B5AEBA9|nr:hypothetical protein [Amaricoccus sp.]MBP7000121.1 hypothetical protein [Amaricoccus sp.]